MRFFGEIAKFLKSNQQCMFLGRWQFGDMAIWGDGSIPTLHGLSLGSATKSVIAPPTVPTATSRLVLLLKCLGLF